MNTPTLGLSLLAGLLSFVSPCVLPLLPSYLGFVGGVTIKEMQEDASIRRGLFVNTLFFVLGFSVVFVTLGVVFSGSSLLAPGATQVINIVAGSIVVVLGLNIMFDFIKVLNMEKRFHFTARPQGKVGSFVVGLAFAAGWTPCIGPILTGILFLAGRSGTVGTGILHLSVYSAGLAIPFLLTALFFNRATGLFAKIKRHFRAIRIGSGALLVAIGLLIALGRFQNLNIALFRAASAAGRWAELNPTASRLLPAVILALLASLALVPAIRLVVQARKSANGDSHPGEGKPLPVVLLAIGLVLLVLAVLQLVGVLNAMGAVTAWLRFQGI
ncbi:MAG: cytochrome c biogenesis CcdA family protein [Spirochaetales bacterium]